MLKKIKKVIAFALALTMLMGMGTMVSAAEKESSIPEYSETNDGGMTVNIAGDQEGTIVEGSGNEEGINPLWWPGDGPAPQVTSISLYKYGQAYKWKFWRYDQGIWIWQRYYNI
ncbi:hypothetical protein [Waltera sp.]|uniref:hypothetical protein n=1 Tax=Waltera sp. TaxID=2815806 RepID=UPI0039A13638